MQCCCGTDTGTSVDIHGTLETSPDALAESVSTDWLSKPAMNAATQRTPYGNVRSTAIFESLHEINEVEHICDIEIFPALARVFV